MITVDTEVDKSADWSIADPVNYSSVTRGIPDVLTPLFERYGVTPTYLLSPEVLEDPGSVEVLHALGDRAELGTHLHAEFIEPDRRLYRENMGRAKADALQSQWPPEIEAEKLRNLTLLFEEAFGYPPRSFRAGRYGMSSRTLEILAGLGYVVDSSITPGLRWSYPEGVVDYRRYPPDPQWVHFDSGTILELPISIWPASRLATMVENCPAHLSGIVRKVLGGRGGFRWLRPSWTSGHDLVQLVAQRPRDDFVVMFHSMEIIPGASPYAATPVQVDRLLESLEMLLAHCSQEGYRLCGLAEAVDYF